MSTVSVRFGGVVVGICASLLATSHQARGWTTEAFDIYIGYKLPDSRDAIALEATCLNKRNVGTQVCGRSTNPAECESNAEIAFRRCVSSIPDTTFFLAFRRLEPLEGIYFPLSSMEAVDPKIDSTMAHLRASGYYNKLDLRIDMAGGSCTVKNSNKGSAAFLPNHQEVCQAFSNYYRRFFIDERDRLVGPSYDVLVDAIAKQQERLVQVMLARGVKPSGEALEAAASTRQVSALELLINNGADVHEALRYAAGAGHVGNVNMSLARGADVNNVDLDGRTALHHVCAGAARKDRIPERVKVTNLLIARGAEVDARDKAGATALYLAALSGNRELVEILVRHGAVVDRKTIEGVTGYPQLADFLRRHAKQPVSMPRIEK